MFFKRKPQKQYDLTLWRPVLRCSICTGEQAAGFQELATGRFEEVMLIRNEADLRPFAKTYGVDHDPKIYRTHRAGAKKPSARFSFGVGRKGEFFAPSLAKKGPE